MAGKKDGQNEASKRLQRELMELMMSGNSGKLADRCVVILLLTDSLFANVQGISAFPEGDNLFR